MLLADRMIVLGRNPARDSGGFPRTDDGTRGNGIAEFLLYVDYIYKVMTQPELVVSPSAGKAAPAKGALPNAASRAARRCLPACSSFPGPRRERRSVSRNGRASDGSGRYAARCRGRGTT